MHELPNNLLFSIDKEITRPSSRAGKVWRILIVSGTLHVGDTVRITSANLVERLKSDFFDIEAEVKSIHEELDAVEGVKEINAASKGGIVGVDIKNCYCGRKRIQKKDIKITKQSVGFLSDEPFENRSSFYIRFSAVEEAFDVIDVGRNVVLLWFGKMVAAKIIDIPDSLEGMHIRLQAGKKLAIPENHILRNEIAKSTKMFTNYRGRTYYIDGLLDFSGDQ